MYRVIEPYAQIQRPAKVQSEFFQINRKHNECGEKNNGLTMKLKNESITRDGH